MKKLLLLFSAAALITGCSEQKERVAVASVSLSDDAATLTIGATKRLTATVLPAEAEIRTVGWSASGDAAQVDQNGLVTALKAGSSIVTVTSVDGKKTDTAIITVRAAAIEPTPSPIEEGYFSVDEAIYHETEIPAGTTENVLSGVAVTNGEAGRTISLGSEVALSKILVGVKGTAGYLELDAAAHLVTRAAYNYAITLTNQQAEKFTLVIAATTADGGVLASQEVAVGADEEAEVAVSGIELLPSTLTLEVATAQTLSWTIQPINATNKAVRFSSADESVATVDAVGKITALKVGTVVITVASAADPTKMDTCNLTITAANVLTKIVDEAFLAFVESKMADWDADKDEKLSATEAAAVKEIGIPELGIGSLAGIEYFTGLERLIAHQNELTTVDVSRNPALIQLLVESNKITSINISGNPALEHLGAGDNQLASVDVSANPLLVRLDVQLNKLAALDVSRNPALEVLYANNNQLTAIDLSANTKLRDLTLNNNLLAGLDIKANTALTAMDCAENPGDGVSKFPVAAWFDNATAPAGFTTGSWQYEGKTIAADYGSKPFNVLDKIPDEAFKAYLRQEFDTNDDGTLTEAEAAAVEQIQLFGFAQTVSSVEGLEYFTELLSFGAREHDLSSIDLTANTKLEALDLGGNNFASLDLSAYTTLKALSVDGNQLTELDITALTDLSNLKATSNQLTSLDVSANTRLAILNVADNALTSLDISANRSLTTFACSDNPGDGVSKFPVAAWFDNADAPTGFTTGSWQYEGKDIAVDYIDPNAEPDPVAVNVLDNIPDEAFKAYAAQFAGDDEVLSEAEAAAVTTMDIPGDAGIASMAGLEYFTGLTMLRCNNFGLTELDVSALTELTELHCDFNNLTSLDISANRSLATFGCSGNPGDGVDTFPVAAWFDNADAPAGFTNEKWTYNEVEITPVYSK